MSFSKTVNLGNSIIGVSILAMPYCFEKSGVLLSILLIIISGFLTRLSCSFLLKSAFISRRRSFELIVHDVLGHSGRVLVELGLIGFLLGTCVAYFIMIGDLAPKIICELFDIKYNPQLKIISMIVLSTFVALPLGLLRSVDSLTSFSLLSLILYSCLILKLMFETTDKLSGTVNIKHFDKITYWNTSGLLTTFPIFSMAMSCQTSLFEIFDSSSIACDNLAIKKNNAIVRQAIYICSFVYVTVGLLGYMAFNDKILTGNILLAFAPSITTTLTKIGFIVTLLMSFPLCLFPCRTSVHSLIIGNFKKSTHFHHLPTSPSAMTLVGMNNIGEANISNNNSNTVTNNNLNKHRGSSLNGGSNLSKTANFSLATSTDTSIGTDDGLQSGQSGLPTGLQARLYISDFQFRFLTVILIIITISLSVMLPHIEFILGIIGSTAGTTVCFILPALTFIKIGEHTLTERLMAKALLILGVAILVFCSYSTILSVNIKTTDNT